MICVIPCCGLKSEEPAKAKDMYLSSLFKLSYKWAINKRYEIIILSAKYGAISPDYEIRPYNLRINQLDKDETDRIIKQVKSVFKSKGINTVISLCGIEYDEIIHKAGIVTVNYLQGLAIGKRMQKLKKDFT